jgi:hypothetical protein
VPAVPDHLLLALLEPIEYPVDASEKARVSAARDTAVSMARMKALPSACSASITPMGPPCTSKMA